MREGMLQIGGHSVLLLADKALYWPQAKLMCIADAHFGKAASYRALGQPVPPGTTSANLARLDRLLANHATCRLVFLGDFMHARNARTPGTLAALQDWRARHPELVCTLVRGNHDLRAGDPAPELRFEVVDEPLIVGTFALRHTPGSHAGHHAIAGHVHPVFQLHGKGRQRLRLPCFYSSGGITLLPSFGDFTGGHRIEAGPASRIFVTDGENVWPVTVANPATRPSVR